MNEEKKEKIWLEIQGVIREFRGAPLPEERTIDELTPFFGLGEDSTRKLMRTLVSKGVFLRRKIGSSKKTFYRPNPSIENFEAELKKIFNDS